MQRVPCVVCNSEDGPAIFASDFYCSVFCKKVYDEEITAAQFEKITGKKVV